MSITPFDYNGKHYHTINDVCRELDISPGALYFRLEKCHNDIAKVFDYYKTKQRSFKIKGHTFYTKYEASEFFNICYSTVRHYARLRQTSFEEALTYLIDRNEQRAVHIPHAVITTQAELANYFHITRQSVNSYIKAHGCTLQEAFDFYKRRYSHE